MAFSAFDTSQNSRNLIPCLSRERIVAVGRYYTRRRNNPKILTTDEASRLSNAGIRIWAVYQNRHRQQSDFSASIGKSEAEDALDYARNVIHQPNGSAIYFSADFDATQREFDHAIRPHFQAVAATFAAAGNPYRIGVYSSGAVCKSLLDAGTVQLTWLSQSGGFRGTRDFKASRRWNLLQFLPFRGFCNFNDEIDPDEINGGAGDFGGFLLPAAAGGAVALEAAAPAADTGAAAQVAVRRARKRPVKKAAAKTRRKPAAPAKKTKSKKAKSKEANSKKRGKKSAKKAARRK